MPPTPEWYDDRERLRAFASVLVDEYILRGTPDVLDFIEKPWKWNEEFTIWQKWEYPQKGDSNWDIFLEELSQKGL